MKKNLLKKLCTAVIMAMSISVGVQAQQAFIKKDSTGFSGSFLQNIRAQKMIFGAINAADNGKDQDLLIFKVGTQTTAATLTFPSIELYKNDGAGNYTLNSSTFDALKQGNGSWSKLDGNIVITGIDGNNADAKTTILYTRDGSGGYVKVTNPVGGVSTFPGITGFAGFIDYNKDGRDDVFLVDNNTGTSYLYQNLGSNQYAIVNNPIDGTSGFPVMILNNYQVTSIAFGDYDKDSYTDIAIAARIGTGASDTYTSIYKNNGNGTFSKITITLDGVPNTNFPGVAYGSIDFGDLDADGYATDLAVTGNTSGNSLTLARVIKVFKQDATNPNVYTTVLSFANGTGGKRYGQIIFGDLTGSGFKKDLITTGQLSSGQVSTDVIITDASSTTPKFTVYAKITENVGVNPVNTTDFASFVSDNSVNANYRFYAFGDVNGDGKKNDVAKFGVPANAGSSIAALYTYNAFNPITLTTATDSYFLYQTETTLLNAKVLSAVPSNPVQKVEFYANNIKIGEVSAAPYQYTTNGLAKGSYIITAKVTYQDATTYVSKPITIVVTTVVPVSAEADTYANGAAKTTEHGSQDKLTVKQDNASSFGFYREAFLRFDLSTVTETSVSKAILRLNEIRTNNNIATANKWQLYFISDDTWDEANLTYNNSRTIVRGSIMAEVPIVKVTGTPSVPVVMEWDITSFLNAELAGDKKISMVLIGSVQDATGDADFASKENADATLRPVLNLYTTPPANPLPVNFISFTAKAATNGVQLNWKVASETDHKQYIVSRSTNGTDYTLVGTTTAYSLLDKNVAQGTYYYKLEQQDNDGTINYLSTQVVKVGLSASNVTVYPNPTKGVAIVAVPTGAYSKYSVVGIQGNTIAKGSIGNLDTTVEINLSAVAAGTYIIKLKGPYATDVTRVIKL